MIRCWRTGLVVAGVVTSTAASALSAQRLRSTGKNYAQRLVDSLVLRNPDVRGVELAVASDGRCATLAGTDPHDFGAPCGEDEREPMRTGEPFVEEPPASDPVFDITQALHDSAGNLVGAVGIDIAPGPAQGRAAILVRARALLRELEAAIPSKTKLFETGP